MNLRINRRTFATTAIAAPVTLSTLTTQAQTPDSSPVMGTKMIVGLTSTLEEWTAAAGEGTPVGETGTLFRFISPTDGVTEVTVGFTEELASFVEYTFGDQGPRQADARALVTASIPTESIPGEEFLLSTPNADSSIFTAQVYAMPSAPNSAILSVMALGALEAEEARVVSISISLPNVEGSEHTATGYPGGIGLSRDEWAGIFGEPGDALGEFELYPGSGPDGMDLAVSYSSAHEQFPVHSIQAYSPANAPVTTTFENAVTFVGGSVPEDTVVGQYFSLPSTDNGPIALDAVLWTSPELQEQLSYKGSVLSMLYILEGETDREVQRIDIAMNTENL